MPCWERRAGARRSQGGGSQGGGNSRIWIVGANNQPEPVYVRQKLSDGTNISVEPRDSGITLEGREVILGINTSGQSSSAVNNPFAPQAPGGAQRRAMR